MKPIPAVTSSLVVSFISASAVAAGDFACPKTTRADPLFGAAYSGWYGSEAFAAEVPTDGTWAPTEPGALLAVKLLWRSPGFRPGSESNLAVTITNLGGGPMTARVRGTSNMFPVQSQIADPRAFGAEQRNTLERAIRTSPDQWRMMSGLDFPDEGCWQIRAEYLGQVLTFVVATVKRDR